ncbi:MAG TPA: hypothetical protein VIV60_15245 [Polyangiaceae bacterium]
MPKRLSILLGIALVLSPLSAEAKKKKKTKQPEPQPTAIAAPAQPSPPTNVQPAEAQAYGVGLVAPDLSDPAVTLEDDASTAQGSEPIPGKSVGGLRMLLQFRYMSTFGDSNISEDQRGTIKRDDGFDVQRVFLRYVASPAKSVDVKFLADFAELKHGNPKQTLKLAYAEVHAHRRLQIDFGLMKRPFSLLELLPIAKHELADLGPTDSFIKDQGYGGRDMGAIIRYQPLPDRRMMTISAGAFRGDIDEGFDSSPLKLLGARIETHPVKHLRLGVNAVYRPYDNVEMQDATETSNSGVETVSYKKVVTMRKGAAAGTDVTLTFRHLEIRAEALLGKRTDPVQLPNGKQSSFWAAWVVVAPRIPIGKWLLVPAARAEVLDTDALNPNGQRRSITGVLGVVPLAGLRVLADVTRTWTDPLLTSLDKVPWSGSNGFTVTEPNSTRATVQAQVLF